MKINIIMRNKNWYPRDEYPKEVNAFIALQKRVKSGYTTTSWQRSVSGFYAFLKTVGRVPKGMEQPSIGRKNHSKGYTKTNCGWQSMRENALDAVNRAWVARKNNSALSASYSKNLSQSLIGKKKSLSHRKNISIAASNRSAEVRYNMSLSQLGKKLSDETKKKIGCAQLGRKRSEKTKIKISLALKGREISPEWRAKISAAMLRRYA